MGASAPTVLEIGAVFALEAAYDAAVAGAVADYRAITVPAAVVHGCSHAAATPEARAVTCLLGVLPASSQGDGAVSWGRVGRLVTEHLLGPTLHAAVHDRPAVDAVGAGGLATVTPRMTRAALLRLRGAGGLALVARFSAGAVLYLLARHGLTGVFDTVVARDAVEGHPAALGELLIEALGFCSAGPEGPEAARVIVAHRADVAALRAAGFVEVECQQD